MRTVRLLTLALSFPLGALRAQSSAAPAEVVSAARLRALGDSLPAGASRTAQLGRGPGLTYALTQRDSSGTVERHDAWTDLFVVQRGSATLVSGGHVVGAREASPGEWRGGTVTGATPVVLHAGDIAIIPAGTAHQMLVAPGERVTYLAYKIAKPAESTTH